MRGSTVRLVKLALVAFVVAGAGASTACSDSSAGPEGATWYDGTWLAVRANNAPLPYRDRQGGSVREMVLTLRSDTSQASSFITNGTVFYNFRENENPVNRTVKVTAGADSVFVYDGPKSTIGQLALTFRRKGDTLVLSSYQSGEFKLRRAR